jgi:hypothetical protein
MKRAIALLIAVAAIALTAAGCSKSASSGASPATFAPSAKAAVSSALANPTAKADLNQTEQLLLTNLQKNFSAAHPVQSVKTADAHPLHEANPARDAWLQGVYAYAVGQGGASPSPGDIGASPSPAASGAHS